MHDTAHNDSGNTDSDSAWFEATKIGDVATLRAMLSRGMDVDATDANGWTALHHAASLNRVEVVAMLIDAGANVNAHDCDGWTPLHVAAWHNEAINLLLGAGAEVNAATRDGLTALHLAAEYELAGAVTNLVRVGADVDARDADSDTPRDLTLGTFRKTFDAIVAKARSERVRTGAHAQPATTRRPRL